MTQEYLSRLIFSLSIIFTAFIFSLLLKKTIDVIFSRVGQRVSHEVILARTRTVRSLLRNIIDIIIFLIAILTILARWDVNIIPILTGAGIFGLAISFGAQSLVKDVISGIFIILEGQFSVGDRIKIDKNEGEVVQITLRLTILQDKKGNYIYIPNSQITTLTRYTNHSN